MKSDYLIKPEPKPEKQPSITGVLLALLFLALSIYVLIYHGHDYWNGIKKTRAPHTGAPQKQSVSTPQQFDTEVKFRKFFITAPGAKTVELLADFNGWGEVPIVLTPYKKIYYDTSIALPSGEYKYVFLVDGKEALDPLNKDIVTFGGREVCVKTVR